MFRLVGSGSAVTAVCATVRAHNKMGYVRLIGPAPTSRTVERFIWHGITVSLYRVPTHMSKIAGGAWAGCIGPFGKKAKVSTLRQPTTFTHIIVVCRDMSVFSFASEAFSLLLFAALIVSLQYYSSLSCQTRGDTLNQKYRHSDNPQLSRT